MPGNLHHQLGANMEALCQMVSFKVTDPATVASVNGPLFFDGDVVVSTLGLGRYLCTITNFRGNRGIAHTIPSVIAASGGNQAAACFIASAGGYASNGDTLTFVIGVNSNGAAAAADFQCFVLAS